MRTLRKPGSAGWMPSTVATRPDWGAGAFCSNKRLVAGETLSKLLFSFGYVEVLGILDDVAMVLRIRPRLNICVLGYVIFEV